MNDPFVLIACRRAGTPANEWVPVAPEYDQLARTMNLGRGARHSSRISNGFIAMHEGLDLAMAFLSFTWVPVSVFQKWADEHGLLGDGKFSLESNDKLDFKSEVISRCIGLLANESGLKYKPWRRNFVIRASNRAVAMKLMLLFLEGKISPVYVKIGNRWIHGLIL